MGTKGTKSSGTQFNPRGVTQGTTLVDPNSGNPISVTTDNSGTRRLAVDADITAGDITVETRDLTAATDAVRIEDPNTGAHLKINLDGSIDADVFLSAFTGTPDSILSVGTEDGTPTGTPHPIRVLADGTVVTTGGGGGGGGGATSPTIFNISVPLAATEISQALPADVKKFMIKVRDYKASLQIAYTAGQSGSNYISVGRGNSYSEDELDVPALTVYFQVDKPSQTVEILAWS